MGQTDRVHVTGFPSVRMLKIFEFKGRKRVNESLSPVLIISDLLQSSCEILIISIKIKTQIKSNIKSKEIFFSLLQKCSTCSEMHLFSHSCSEFPLCRRYSQTLCAALIVVDKGPFLKGSQPLTG